MTSAWDPCPYAKKGRHAISVLVPDTTDMPCVLFCDACGMTEHVSLNLPAPLDDLTAADIQRLARNTNG